MFKLPCVVGSSVVVFAVLAEIAAANDPVEVRFRAGKGGGTADKLLENDTVSGLGGSAGASLLTKMAD